MRTYYLLPTYFRPIGFMLAIPGLILGFLFLFFGIVIPGFGPPAGDDHHNMTARLDNYTNELALALTIAGIMFIAFAKLKNEDELTAKLRLNALYWAILTNYLILIFGTIVLMVKEFIFGLESNAQILDYNLFIPLIIFLVRFYYLLYKSKDEYHVAPLRFLPYNPFNRMARLAAIPCIILFIPCLIYGLFYAEFFKASPFWYEYSDPVYYILPIVLLIWMYLKERVEDEYINTLRLRAMQTAIYINSIILLLANFIFYSLDFLAFEVWELSITPLIFVIIFQYNLFRLLKQTTGKNEHRLNINTL